MKPSAAEPDQGRRRRPGGRILMILIGGLGLLGILTLAAWLADNFRGLSGLYALILLFSGLGIVSLMVVSAIYSMALWFSLQSNRAYQRRGWLMSSWLFIIVHRSKLSDRQRAMADQLDRLEAAIMACAALGVAAVLYLSLVERDPLARIGQTVRAMQRSGRLAP